MSIRTLPARISGALAIVGLSSWASAATLVDYKPLPVSPTTPEFVFGGGPVPSFSAGPGATGNGDGTAAVAAQTPGGLVSETPFIIPGIPGSLLKAASTDFFDSTLVLGGLAASAPAVAAGGVFIQALGPGTFSIFSTDPPGAPLPTLLLTGTIAGSSFIVGAGDAAGEFNSFGVTYTGGAILPFMLAAGGIATGNSMSISMTDVSPTLGINGATGFLSDFTANATGLFNYQVPEPTSLAVMGLAGAAFVRRRVRA